MKIIDAKALKDLKGINLCRTTLWDLERTGKFPKKIQISPGRTGWLESEVDDWIAQRAAERGNAEAS